MQRFANNQPIEFIRFLTGHLQIEHLSVTLFEKMPIHQALAGDENRCNASQITNQLNLFDF